MSTDDGYEAHAVAQSRAARLAHEADTPRSRGTRERHGCAPAKLNRDKSRARPARVDRIWDDCKVLEDVPESEILGDAYAVPEPICDERLAHVQSVIYRLLDLLLMGEPDRPAEIISAVKACFRGEHVGESTSEIAKAHGAPIRPLRRLLVGLRSGGIL